MADSAKRIANLVSASVLSANDYLIIEANTHQGANSVTKKITVTSMFNDIPVDVVIADNKALVADTIVFANTATPANSTANVATRSMWFDNTYIYVALSNNVIRRVAHSSF